MNTNQWAEFFGLMTTLMRQDKPPNILADEVREKADENAAGLELDGFLNLFGRDATPKD